MEDHKNLVDASSMYRSFLRHNENTALNLEGEDSKRADAVQKRYEDKDKDATEKNGAIQNKEGSNLEKAYLAKPGLSEEAPNDMHGVEEVKVAAEINPRNKDYYADSLVAMVKKNGRGTVKVSFHEITKEICDQDEEKEITFEDDVPEKVEKHKSQTQKARVFRNVGWKSGSDEETEIGFGNAAVKKEYDNRKEEAEVGEEGADDEDSDDEEILPEDLLGFAWQITKGMVRFANKSN